MRPPRVGEIGGRVSDIRVSIQRLRIRDTASKGIGTHESAQARIIVASEGVVEPRFGVTLVTRKLVVGRTRRLRRHFLSIRSKRCLIAGHARCRRNGRRAPYLVGIIEIDIRRGCRSISLRYSLARKENILPVGAVRRTAGQVRLRNRVACEVAPVKRPYCPVGLFYPQAITVVSVSPGPARGT